MVRSNLQVYLAALLLWSHKQILAADPSRMVSLPLGNIQGAPCPINPRVTQYLGVPFAQPALGNLRFRSPELYSTPYSKPALQATSPPPPCGSVCGQMWMPDDASGSSEVLFHSIIRNATCYEILHKIYGAGLLAIFLDISGANVRQ